MTQELLDFETPMLSNYEKFLNKIEAVPTYLKVFVILLFNLLIALIIHQKASPEKDPVVSFFTVTGGLFILLVSGGYFFQLCLTIGCHIVDIITKSMPKIKILGFWSITLLLSLLSLITIGILAIFVP